MSMGSDFTRFRMATREKIEQLERKNTDLDLTLAIIEDIIDDSHRSDNGKLYAIMRLLEQKESP